jgi:hypothetical protein
MRGLQLRLLVQTSAEARVGVRARRIRIMRNMGFSGKKELPSVYYNCGKWGSAWRSGAEPSAGCRGMPLEKRIFLIIRGRYRGEDEKN